MARKATTPQAPQVDSEINTIAGLPSTMVAAAAETLGLDPAIADLVQQPTREVTVTLPLVLHDGGLRVFRGFRVQHQHGVGPCMGGVRLESGADLEQLRALSLLMSLRCSLLGIPFGGAKGAITCDPHTVSRGELRTLTKAYTMSIAHAIGPDQDVLGPDLGTNEAVMAWILDAYSQRVGRATPAVVSGKTLLLGGTRGRRQVTGHALGFVALLYASKIGLAPDRMRVAIQGFGNVGSETAAYLHARGVKVVAVSDYNGGVYNKAGLDIPAVQTHIAKPARSFVDFKDGTPLNGPTAVLEVPCDALIPAALENQLTAAIAPRVKAKLIVEGAIGPTTPQADSILAKRDALVVPALLGSAGGVVLRYLEWLQNKGGVTWSEESVLGQVEEFMQEAVETVEHAASQFGVSRRMAAHVAALERIAGTVMPRLL